MGELFEMVFQYRTLLARLHADRDALSLPERVRLDALGRLLGREPDDRTSETDVGRRHHARCNVRLGATLRVDGGVLAVDVLNLGAGGVCVLSREPLARGGEGTLRIRSEDGTVYECLARAAWVRPVGTRHLVGLRFLGAPVDHPHGVLSGRGGIDRLVPAQRRLS